jgi:hypothetical protein
LILAFVLSGRIETVIAATTRLLVAGEPALDALAVLRDLVPLVARQEQRSRLNALCDLVNLFVRQLVAALDPECLRCIRVSCNRLAVDAGLAADLPVAVPRRPAAKHLFHIDHG